MDYDSTLQWLQQLLGTQQSTNATQWGQALTAEQQAQADALANQKAMQAASLTSQQQMQQSGLGEQGREFDASTALQKVIADWQNTLATNQQAQSAQAQKFGQNFSTQQYNDSRAGLTAAQLNNAYTLAHAGDAPTHFGIPMAQYAESQNPYSSQYTGGTSLGDGWTHNPYTGMNTLNYGAPYGPLSLGLVGSNTK